MCHNGNIHKQEGAAFFYYSLKAGESYRYSVRHCDLEKLDLFGAEYLFELTRDKIEEDQREKNYRTYISELLKYYVETFTAVMGGSVDIPHLYDTKAEGKKDKHETSETPEEIKQKILGRFRKLKGEDKGNERF